MDWSGVVLSAVCTHSDGTHSLPLVSKWCDATFLQIWWRNNLEWPESTVILGNVWVNYSFNNFLVFNKKSHCSSWKTTLLSVVVWMLVSGVNHSQGFLMLAQNKHWCWSDLGWFHLVFEMSTRYLLCEGCREDPRNNPVISISCQRTYTNSWCNSHKVN